MNMGIVGMDYKLCVLSYSFLWAQNSQNNYNILTIVVETHTAVLVSGKTFAWTSM